MAQILHLPGRIHEPLLSPSSSIFPASGVGADYIISPSTRPPMDLSLQP